MLGILYDIHGNLDALEVVLADADAVGVDRWLLGGDYGAVSWLLEPPEDRPEVSEVYQRFRGQLPDDEVQWLYSLPPQAELDGVLYVHGSPLADDDSFAPEPQEDEERLLTGAHGQTIVFGHSHQQFRRSGPSGTDLVNPGSVGMPLDGDRRAAWATRNDEFAFRRSEYDVERAAAAYRAMGGDFGEFAARRIEKGSD